MSLFRKYLLSASCCFCGNISDNNNNISSIVPEQDSSLCDTNTNIKVFDYSTIATHITTTSALIAIGGFSTIHLSSLPSSPSTPAVFKLHEPTQRLYRMFHQELSILRQLNHPNIVRLLGYSDDNSSSSGILILEHVPNGTLHDNLQQSPTLSWSQRVSIAFKLANALDYLHGLQIVHGDIKASNVLIGSKKIPKLCDFGFWKMGFLSAVERGNGMMMMMGSPGYVDPWYLRTGLVSKKSDVYSFGVLVFEMLTGLEATALTAAVKGGGVVVDERMKGECDEGEMVALTDIARMCVGENTSLRPTMGEIVRMMRENVAGDKKNI